MAIFIRFRYSSWYQTLHVQLVPLLEIDLIVALSNWPIQQGASAHSVIRVSHDATRGYANQFGKGPFFGSIR